MTKGRNSKTAVSDSRYPANSPSQISGTSSNNNKNRRMLGAQSYYSPDSPQQQVSPKTRGTTDSLASRSRLFYKNIKLSSPGISNPATAATLTKSSGVAQRHQQRHSLKHDDHAGSYTLTSSFNQYFGGANGGHQNISIGSNKSSKFGELNGMNVDETSNGIEVSLDGTCDQNKTKSSMSSKQQLCHPIVSLKDQFVQRKRVYEARFSTVTQNQQHHSSITSSRFSYEGRPKGHRIPLLNKNSSLTNDTFTYSENLQLLQTAPCVEEWTAVKQELLYLDDEISLLEKDRSCLKEGENEAVSKPMVDNDQFNGCYLNNLITVDAMNSSFSAKEKYTVKEKRGDSLTLHLHNDRMLEMFISNFCADPRKNHSTVLSNVDDSIKTILPSHCKSPHRGTGSLYYLTLISTNDQLSNGIRRCSIFISRDEGKSECIGRIPNRLYRRLKEDEGATGRHDISDIRYLSTGQCGCYFAKFESGESWWGLSVEDADFHGIMHTWDVYRVAFGPLHANTEKQICEQQHQQQESSTKASSISIATQKNKAIDNNSWIILGYDGRVSWKNIPSHLSNILKRRRLSNCAALIDVSLGPGDSYFARFLDGSTEYCLPSKVSKICEKIQQRGGDIIGVCLNPDISDGGFIIRHTDLS